MHLGFVIKKTLTLLALVNPFMGVSLALIRIGGGAIMFIVSLAMVIAKEETIKSTQRETEDAASGPSIVPLGITLLAGPAALSYVIMSWQRHR